MINKDEALKMAIEALPELILTAQAEYESKAKAYEGYPNMAYRYNYLKDIADEGMKVINACKEALEQPDRPTNAVLVPADKLKDMQCRLKALEQPVQEPVAWIYFHNRMEPNMDVQFEEPEIKKSFDDDVTWKKPLYTHPHQWQGLTDDEIDKIIEKHKLLWMTTNFARAIEQASRNKNYGN